MHKKLLLIIPILYLSMSSAFALSPSPSNVTTAIAAVNSSVLAQSGIAATSTTSTIMRSNVGGFLGGAIAAVGGPTNLLKIATTGIVGLAINYAVYEGGQYVMKKFSRNPDGKFTYNAPATSAPISSPAFTSASGGYQLSGGYSSGVIFSSNYQSLESLAQAYVYNKTVNWTRELKNFHIDADKNLMADELWTSVGGDTNLYTNRFVASPAVAPYDCPANNYFDGNQGKCIGSPAVSTPAGDAIAPAESLPAVLPANDLTAPVDAQSLANLINNVNSQMAQNPNNVVIPQVTAADVTRALGSNMPTVGDFINPVSSPAQALGSTTVPTDSNTTMTATTSKPAPVDPNAPPPAKIDLGPDPGVGTPTLNLEDTPTASMILTPVFNLMPDMKNLVISDVGGVCPFNTTFNIPFFHRDYSFSFICDFLSQNSVLLQSAFLIFFGILSALIILGA